MLLSTTQKNRVLETMAQVLLSQAPAILSANQADLAALPAGTDLSIRDRLLLTEEKVAGMIRALQAVARHRDPVDQVLSEVTLSNGLRVVNRTVPFGTILIIYESRPDVTVEAASLAFKAGSRILLKGGREAQQTNFALWQAWQSALQACQLAGDWIKLLTLSRIETERFLQHPPERMDLIVPRGGESLIAMVKTLATCPVLVSGRGNNFLFVEQTGDWGMANALIHNGKLQKISACNALDKVLFQRTFPNLIACVQQLTADLSSQGVKIWVDPELSAGLPSDPTPTWERLDCDSRWDEEFLDYKLLIGVVADLPAAIDSINRHSGGHSACIVTQDGEAAERFLREVDCAAVYHNASTRFTDGGQLGLGAELAISTAKLHHRGPIGLEQLVSNKYYIFGQGQCRT
jgi:glutamate-5-semialdehyde dehydrogenase